VKPSEETDVLLSQLVDGELPVDQANQVLSDVLGELGEVPDNAPSFRRLKTMLRMRRALGPWRRQEPLRQVIAVAPPAPASRARHLGWRITSLATAALVGAVLAAGALLWQDRRHVAADREPTDPKSTVIVGPEQRREIARAFALHESVAGPLSWYVTDDATIQVAPADRGQVTQQPIAVVLRLALDPSCPRLEAMPPKTYVIVCRNTDAAVIELPGSAMAASLRLRLLPMQTNGQVNLQYVLAADGQGRGQHDAALVGRRHVGLDQTSLGQLAMNDCLVDVDASAWVIGDSTR